MTVRPWGLVCIQGIGCAVLGLVFVIVEVAGGQPNAVVVGLGCGLLAVAAVSFVPVLEVDRNGVHVRNFFRHYRWRWDELRSIGLRETQMVLTRSMAHTQLVIDDGVRRVPVAATTALSKTRFSRLLTVLQDHRELLDASVDQGQFPRPDPGDALRALSAESAEEWASQQEVYERLRRERERQANE